MAIVQISRIQVRRGLDQDLPQLASGEMGWSTNVRKLYIGNGVTDAPDFAPEEGVTEILTENSNFLEFIKTYTFRGTDSGYTSQTTATAGVGFTRSLQSVLDETVSVKHFGAVGNGTTDDTAAIDRAIRQIYVSSLNTSHPPVRRTIKFPAGTYKITSNIVIPPNCTVVGDGKNNTIISGNAIVFQSCDSLFQTGGALGFGGAQFPEFITISDLALETSSTADPVALFTTAGNIAFNRVQFLGGTYGLSLNGSSDNIEINNSTFSGASTGAINVSESVGGLVTRSNYFDTIKLPLTLGVETSVTTLSAGAGKIDYEIISGTDYKMGTMKYNVSGGVCSFDDEVSASDTSTITANLYAHADGEVTCISSAAATLKYNITQFI